jgi:hypothetical protein
VLHKAPLHLTPPSMALSPLTMVVTTPTTTPRCSLNPYRRAKSTPSPHRAFPPSLSSSLMPTITLVPSSSHRRSSPLHRCSCCGEHPSNTASSGSSSSTFAGEHQQALAPARHALARCRRALLYAPPQSTVDPSCTARSTGFSTRK